MENDKREFVNEERVSELYIYGGKSVGRSCVSRRGGECSLAVCIPHLPGYDEWHNKQGLEGMFGGKSDSLA